MSSQAGCSGLYNVYSVHLKPDIFSLVLCAPAANALYSSLNRQRGLASLKIFALASLSSWVMSICPSAQLKYSFFREILTFKLNHPSAPTQTGFLSHNILFYFGMFMIILQLLSVIFWDPILTPNSKTTGIVLVFFCHRKKRTVPNRHVPHTFVGWMNEWVNESTTLR